MVDMKYKDGSVNTDHDIVGLLIAIVFGGHHNSSITSTWTALFTIRYCTSALTKFQALLCFCCM